MKFKMQNYFMLTFYCCKIKTNQRQLVQQKDLCTLDLGQTYGIGYEECMRQVQYYKK